MCLNVSKNDRVRIELLDTTVDVDGEYHQEDGIVLTGHDNEPDTGKPAERLNQRIDPDRFDLDLCWFPGNEVARFE
jgi:hypothetical protein